MSGGGDGTLGFIVWPTHCGAVNDRGEEPMGDPDYGRGQINWAVNEQGRLVGNTRVNVPAGDWTHLIYTHNPTQPGFITATKLAHPLRMTASGTIDLIDITDDDVLTPNKVLR